MMLATGLLQVANNSQIAEAEKRALEAEADARQNEPVILGIAAYIRTCWEAARDAKRPIETIMLKAKRQRNGEYEADKLAEINRAGGSGVFMKITEVKCRAAESWVRDILLDGGEPPWDLQATPIPDLNPIQLLEMERSFTDKVVQLAHASGLAPDPSMVDEMRDMYEQDFRMMLNQEAQETADRMAEKIKDQFAEGGWVQAFNEFVTDLTTYPAAFIKGPVVRRQMSLGWEQGPDGRTKVNAVERLAPEYERVDPFRIYPEPGITNIEDGYLFEHHPMPRSELAALIGVPGYDDAAIRKVLSEGARNSWFFTDIELTKNELERKPQSWRTPTGIFDVLEFWGKVSGQMLIDWGMDPAEVPDPAKEYDANVFTCGNYVLKAVLNQDPLGEKPYAKSSFFKVPGAFWGMGIPEMIEDLQNVCNAAARSLVNNMALASGPQVEISIDRLASNEDITQIFPWKIWQTQSDPMATSPSPAVRFNQPNDNSASLMAVYEKFSRLADEHSGIPAYVSGDIEVSGAGRTSSGLSMLMGAAGKGIRQVITYIDNDVIKTIVQRQFVYNMRYDEDESIKGDLIIVPRGAINLAVKETTNVRRIEFLQATANPFDVQIMGMEGRAAVLREISKALQMPHDQVVPTREKLAYQAAQAAALPAPGQPQGTQETNPDGTPVGGQEGNTVTNQNTGRA